LWHHLPRMVVLYDLHDDVGGTLHGVSFQLRSTRQVDGKNEAGLATAQREMDREYPGESQTVRGWQGAGQLWGDYPARILQWRAAAARWVEEVTGRLNRLAARP
jgi:hypothetical protein